MTLTDTGPLFALADPQGQAEPFARCAALLPSLSLPLVTTWPCFAEAMYLCGREGGWPMQRALWGYVLAETLTFALLSPTDARRMAALMEAYAETPMDLADASLVAVAGTHGLTRIFSLDSDFTFTGWRTGARWKSCQGRADDGLKPGDRRQDDQAAQTQARQRMQTP